VFTNEQPVARGFQHAGHLLRFARPGAIAAFLLMPALAPAQAVTEPALKAAYIYNFAKFTEWPAETVPAAEPLVMCVLGDAAVADALERAVKGRELSGHSMTVFRVPPAQPQRDCQILYVSGVTAGQAAQAVAGLHEIPVLTISDIEGFTELGGIVQLFFEHAALRFAIHVGSARRAHLQISSSVLALARLK
jgi:hypothetical protein